VDDRRALLRFLVVVNQVGDPACPVITYRVTLFAAQHFPVLVPDRVGQKPVWGVLSPVDHELNICLRSLRHDLDPAVVQRLPDTEIQIDFHACLLIMKFVRQIDPKQVGSEQFNAALTLFEEGTQAVSLGGIV
jgi:hypothetical protein